jgi:hypothetical protein
MAWVKAAILMNKILIIHISLSLPGDERRGDSSQKKSPAFEKKTGD